ncbi:hypothetical protein AWZ92_23495 [Shigella sonnei]|nr:hypothetical protein AWZ92_23495 [Shigella sonnei]
MLFLGRLQCKQKRAEEVVRSLVGSEFCIRDQRIPELMRDLASMGQLVKLPTRRERAFPRVVKERPWKYPTAPKKSQSVA